MDFGPVLANLPYLISGLGGTITLAIGAMIVGIAAGLVLGLARISSNVVIRTVSGIYVDFVRSVPLLIILVFYVYAFPILFEQATGTHIIVDPLFAAITGLGFYEAAYFGEVFRTGILAVPSGQREAAISTGMTGAQAMRRVILPQAIRKMIPPTASLFATLTKDTSVAFAIAVQELMAKAGFLMGYTFKVVEVLTVVAVIYFILLYPMTVLANYLQRRVVQTL